MRRFDLI